MEELKINYAMNEFVDRFILYEDKYNFVNSVVACAFGYTNESLRAFYDLLNSKGGRVATVGSSADQAFYAVYNGAEAVDGIDGCAFTEPCSELKKAAVINMERKEFLDYWQMDNVFDEKIYKDLLGDVNDNSKQFFDFLSREFPNKADALGFSLCHENSFLAKFPYKGSTWSNMCKFYDSDDEYNKLKSKLKSANIAYKYANFDDFPKVLEGKYSTILLSNILDYYVMEGKQDKFYSVAKELINKNLIKNGTMQVHYDMYEHCEMEPEIKSQFKGYGKLKRFDVQTGDDQALPWDLLGELSGCDKDKIFTCEKSRNNLYLDQGKNRVYILEK